MNFFKIKSSDTPTKPKPTDILPDNLMYVWDPNANDWIILQKDTNKATPPLYNPQNQNLVNNNATTYMSNVKTASSDKYEYMLLDRLIQDAKYFIEHPDLKHLWAKTLDEHIAKMKEQYTKLDPKPEWTSEDSIDELAKKMKEAYSNHWNEVHPDNKIESSLTNCLSEFLDGPRYSKEIKIETGLIKDGLVKYAGFDFNKGTKYEITEKGLEVLRKASEAEHNEAQNEREKLAYLFGFNTDEVSTLDTTGKVIKSDKKYTICEADGTELGEVEANSELDAKVKFGIEHPEYADSQSISAKEVKSQYEQTTNTKEPYPNPSETPHDDIVLENHDGWVNTASFEDDIGKQFQKPHQKLPNSDRDLELLEKQVLDLIDEDKKEQIKALFDKVQFSDKEAAKVTPEFAKLHKLLGEYRKQNLIQLADVDGNLVASGDPQVINNLEHEVKDIGYYCESVSEDTDSDYAETYSLKIFMK